ncbi:hypothetical protein [Streptomyces sp. NPDC020983]|uniref:hypothetical protein n=1 Tax=Streptomyces sp. NPDC020983 TaxID=3365106 RepID=UPI00379904BD
MDEELSRAVALFHSGTPGGRYHQADAVVDAFGPGAAQSLISRINAIVSQAWDFGNQYDRLGLGQAAQSVQTDLQQAHPELSDEAVKAIALYWSFCNR